VHLLVVRIDIHAINHMRTWADVLPDCYAGLSTTNLIIFLETLSVLRFGHDIRECNTRSCRVHSGRRPLFDHGYGYPRFARSRSMFCRSCISAVLHVVMSGAPIEPFIS
jgi:hypothetical protein